VEESGEDLPPPVAEQEGGLGEGPAARHELGERRPRSLLDVPAGVARVVLRRGLVAEEGGEVWRERELARLWWRRSVDEN
jgi:hypothetical protein